MSTEQQDPLVGTVIAETYRVVGKLGAGGMGSIYEVEHVRMGRRFALKLLEASLAENEEVFQRFKREAEIAGQLGHPNIVEVTDFNRTMQGIPYIVMEKLAGLDLADQIAQRGPYTFQQAYPLLSEMVDALEAAHAAGIVHRDLKPQNIFLCEKGRRTDYVKLLDFGISKMKESGSIVTKTNAVMGTPYYMSPEQAEGRNAEVDARTDIFAFGAIIYEMLTGRLAFYAPSVPTALFKVCFEEPEPIQNVLPDLPPGLADVIGKALSKDREARYASARMMGDDLDRIFQGEQAKLETGVAHKVRTDPSLPAPIPGGPTTLSGTASQVMDSQTMVPQPRSNTLPILLAILGVVAVIVAAVLVVFGMRNKEQKSAPPSTAQAASMDANDPARNMAPLSNEVTLTFYVTPKEAKLLLDGKEQSAGAGTVKREITMTRAEKALSVKVVAPGYAPRDGTVVPVQDQTVTINLYREGQVPRDARRATSGFKVTHTRHSSRSHHHRRRRAVAPPPAGTRARARLSVRRIATPRPRPRRPTMARSSGSMRGGGAAADDL